MDLSAKHWPTLNESVQNTTKSVKSPENGPSNVLEQQPIPDTSKKKKKPGKNFTIGLGSFMKTKPPNNRKQIKFKTHPVKRTGNPLDSDQPRRHSGGKQRPDKKKRATVMKRRVLCSRKSSVKFLYSAQLLDLKSKLFQLVKSNDSTTETLTHLFDRINLEPLDATVEPVQSNVAAFIHSKKFRSYCTNYVTPDLKKASSDLIVTLRTFQDRLYAQNKIKAGAKRRYVCGIKESKKLLLADYVKCLLIGCNLEMEEGLPSFPPFKEILDAALQKNVPAVFCGKGEDIGFWTLKKRKISILAILSYEGADDKYNAMMLSWKRATDLYDDVKKQVASKLAVNRNENDMRKIENEIRESIILKLEG